MTTQLREIYSSVLPLSLTHSLPTYGPDKFLPLSPVLVVRAGVAEPHVEVGRHDEGEEGHRARADEVEDVAEARDGFCDEEEDDDADGAEEAALPVEVWKVVSGGQKKTSHLDRWCLTNDK